MCKSVARAAVAAVLVCYGSVEAQNFSQVNEVATAAAAPGAASRSWLAKLVHDSGLPVERDGNSFIVTVEVGGEPISLTIQPGRMALVGEKVLAIWSTLLCVDDDQASAPGLARAVAKVSQSAADRISAREERDHLVVVYESSASGHGLTSEGLRSLLTAEASAVQRALHLLQSELAKS